VKIRMSDDGEPVEDDYGDESDGSETNP